MIKERLYSSTGGVLSIDPMIPEEEKSPPQHRWLITLVVVMTVLIFVAFMAVIYGMAVTAQQL